VSIFNKTGHTPKAGLSGREVGLPRYAGSGPNTAERLLHAPRDTGKEQSRWTVDEEIFVWNTPHLLKKDWVAKFQNHFASGRLRV